MNSLGPDDRALFEDAGMALYEAVVSAGGIAGDDPRIAPDGPWAAAFALLVRLGLLQRSSEEQPGHWTAEDPASVQSRIVSPLSVQGARLLEESSQWAHDFASVTQIWRRAPEASGRGPFTYVHGDHISPFIEGLVAECEVEVLTAQPQTGRDTDGLALAIQRESALLGRGATMRTLYQHAARRSSVTREYVAAVTRLGAEVRTLDEFFNRMLVFDRRIALIPAPDTFDAALAIREPTVVAYLVDVFERSWERARPFTSSDASVLKDIAAEQRAMTMRMLIEGHSDPAAAKRLGVSPRTYAGYVADLKDEFEAETRFQLGYMIGRLGITGSGDAEQA
ncbi:LuxR family transcriptional regulator [Nocardioides sp. DS6]|uniref:LuxR family transcriptional regulator n=1 Tax=Nocardioides eburneus TaxID=3231482 RepID=A0ABV3SWT3_9ACTN